MTGLMLCYYCLEILSKFEQGALCECRGLVQKENTDGGREKEEITRTKERWIKPQSRKVEWRFQEMMPLGRQEGSERK